MKSAEALQQAAEEVIARQCRSVAIPRRVSEQIREIWILQHKLEQRRRVIPTLQLRRFRAAYDFLLLRAVLGEVPQSLCDWWTEIQELPYDDQAQWVRQLKRKGKNFQKEQG